MKMIGKLLYVVSGNGNDENIPFVRAGVQDPKKSI